ncbi:trans-L-3-hydroxyproline dehydratase-like [Babylonia areolata]|uniref:trans-L-3-hydroxyproline dehydratase-like n=1 Tax=Babylonia areolata TaxID=304850 RepID=UPI003FD36843
MHTGGGPLRIVESGFPQPEGATILEKRAWLRAHADAYRQLVMFEPRGHYEMFGAVLVPTDLPEADLAAIFIHNEGYSTMCGHGVIALGRYAVDRGLVAAVSPETRVVIQCPCGPVPAYVTCKDNVTSDVRFTSVPSYVFAADVEVEVPGVGEVRVDITYGGAFYAVLPASRLGLDLAACQWSVLADQAFAVTKAVQAKVKIHHPDHPDLAFLFGTIVTDGGDHVTCASGSDPSTSSTSSVCVFADKQVDRSPCGSGTTARVALQYTRGVLSLGQKRHFRSGVTGSLFTGCAVQEVKIAGAGMDGNDVIGVRAEVSGNAYYTGTSIFTVEGSDPLAGGFLPRQI